MKLQRFVSRIRREMKTFKPLQRNVIVFTTHKAGSMVLHQVLRHVCEKNRITYYSPNQGPDKQLPFDRIFNGEDFIAERNGCFGPLRFLVPTAALDKANIVLHLRDPRDVLTSMFFSYCFMHQGEIAANTGYRKEVADAGIDKFVLDISDENFSQYRGDYGTGGQYGTQIGSVRDRYLTYLREIVGRPNATLLSYEEMVLDFPNWLRKLLAVFELDDTDDTYSLVMSRVQVEKDVTRPKRIPNSKPISGNEEDVRSHRRKATPGDHKKKLQPETILKLNERFSEVLDALGYSRSCNRTEAEAGKM